MEVSMIYIKSCHGLRLRIHSFHKYDTSSLWSLAFFDIITRLHEEQNASA